MRINIRCTHVKGCVKKRTRSQVRTRSRRGNTRNRIGLRGNNVLEQRVIYNAYYSINKEQDVIKIQ